MQTLEDLARRYLARGDEEAVEELVRRTRGTLRRVARRITREADTEDCLQTAYLSLMHKRGKALDAPVLPWLVRAVIRIAYRHKARRLRDEELARRLGFAHEPDGPLDAAIAAEERHRIRQCVDRLPETYRDALVLHDLEGLSTAETARLLGVSEANVRKRLERARRILRSALGPRVAGLLLLLPWLFCDAAAGALFIGAIAMQKTAIVATVASVLALATGVVVWRAEAEPCEADRAELPAMRVEHPPESETEEDGPRSLVGRVTDLLGRPIADALVLAMPPDMEGAIDPSVPQPPVIQGRTDVQGSFALDFEGEALLYAVADGFCPLVTAETEIALAPAGSLAGTVMDAARTAVAGGRVRWMGLLGGVRIERETRSGPDGAYRLDGLPTSAAFTATGFGCGSWIEARADGFPPLLFARGTLPLGPEHRLDIVLVVGGRVEGVVVDAEDGAPVAGARVVLFTDQSRFVEPRPGGGRIANPFAPGTLFETHAGPDGSFAFDSVPAAGFHDLVHDWRAASWLLGQVAAEAPGHVSRPEGVAAPAPGATVHVKVVCWPAAEVTGRVVDGAGRPQPGVDVWAYVAERSLGDMRGRYGTRVARSDGEGRYRLDGVPATRSGCRTTLFARPPDWPGMIPGAATVEADVRAGEVTNAPDIVIRGLDVPSVAVVVIDEKARPVPGVRLSFAQVGFDVTTDGEGRARVYQHSQHGAGPPPLHLYARGDGYAPQVTGVVEPAVEAPDVTIALSRGSAIEGRVVWRNGEPAGGASLWVFNGLADAAKVGTMSAYVPYPQSEGLPLLTFYGSARADSDGTFMIEGLPDGPCHVHATCGNSVGKLVGVVTGARGLKIELPADPPARGATLAGTVTDAATGQPLVRFDAAVYRGTQRIEATYPTLGAFRIENVTPGTWTFQVTAKGYTSHEGQLEVAHGVAPLAVAMRRGAIVQGHLRNESDVDFASVGFVDEGGNFTAGATLDSEGGYRATGLVPARYCPVAWPRGEPIPKPHIGIGTLVVGEGDRERAFDFVVRRSGELRIEVRTGTQLHPDAMLRIEDEANEPFLEVRGNRALYSRQWFVPLGRYRITVLCPGRDADVRMVDVRADSSAKADFELP